MIKPIHPDDYREFMIRDLLFLQGVATGLEDTAPLAAKAIRSRTEDMKKTMKGLMLSLFPEQGISDGESGTGDARA